MILLDTHTWLWMSAEPKKLSKEAAREIRRGAAGGGLAIAAISLYETAWLFASGKVRSTRTASQALQRMIETTRVETLELSLDIAATAAQLPDAIPRDPADRMIVATALVHAIPLVTKDSRITESGVCRVIW
jgi:PIN domain nuclease of toxin-antitoxin system